MKQLSNLNPNKLTDLTIPAVDHQEPEDDDCGLPQNPIYSNYSKYLWKRPHGIGEIQLPDSHQNPK